MKVRYGKAPLMLGLEEALSDMKPGGRCVPGAVFLSFSERISAPATLDTISQ